MAPEPEETATCSVMDHPSTKRTSRVERSDLRQGASTTARCNPDSAATPPGTRGRERGGTGRRNAWRRRRRGQTAKVCISRLNDGRCRGTRGGRCRRSIDGSDVRGGRSVQLGSRGGARSMRDEGDMENKTVSGGGRGGEARSRLGHRSGA